MKYKKSLSTIVSKKNCVSKKHRIPREMLSHVEVIDRLNFVEYVGTGRFRPVKNKRKGNIDFLGFDKNRGSYIVKIIGEEFEQKFFIKINYQNAKPSLKKDHIENIIKTFYS